MTALDDRPVYLPTLPAMDLPPRRPGVSLSEAQWTRARLAYRGAPVLVAFTDLNPITGTALASSTWEYLPYMIGVLVRRLVGDVAEWDELASAGRTLDLVGEGLWRVPGAMTGVPMPPPLPGSHVDPCPDCGGSGIDVDPAGEMTGVRGALFVCFCAGDPR